jgi:hypothetical protein
MFLETPQKGVLIFSATRNAPFRCNRECTYQQPGHIAAHLHAQTSQHYIRRLSKKLQFCPRTIEFLLHLSFYEKLNLGNDD